MCMESCVALQRGESVILYEASFRASITMAIKLLLIPSKACLCMHSNIYLRKSILVVYLSVLYIVQLETSCIAGKFRGG